MCSKLCYNYIILSLIGTLHIYNIEHGKKVQIKCYMRDSKCPTQVASFTYFLSIKKKKNLDALCLLMKEKRVIGLQFCDHC